MKHEFGIKQLYITIILSVIFGATSLVDLGTPKNPLDPIVLKLRYLLVGTGFILLFLIKHIEDRQGNNFWSFDGKTSPLLWSWLIFCFTLVVSATVNNDVLLLRDSYWLLLGVPIVFFRVLPRVMKDNSGLIVPLALVLGHLPYLLISLVRFPPYLSTDNFYRGVYANSNQLGFSCVVISIGTLILLIGSILDKKPVYYRLLLGALLLTNLVTICYAYSRASLISFTFLSIISSFIIFGKKPKSFAQIALVSSFLVSLLLHQTDRLIVFLSYDLGLDFAEITGKKGSSLSGRDTIWLETWQDWRFFGHGHSYHVERFGLGAHNSVVTILGNNGLIAAYSSLFVILASLIYTYIYFKKNFAKNCYAVTPWLITVGFWNLSIAEDMFGSLGKGITLAYFVSLGIVMTKPKAETLPQTKLNKVHS